MLARGPVRAAVWPVAAGAEEPHQGPRAGAPVPRSGLLAGPQRGAVALPAGGIRPVEPRLPALRQHRHLAQVNSLTEPKLKRRWDLQGGSRGRTRATVRPGP